MSLDNLELSLMAFPQRWDGSGRLFVNLLVLPVGDPTAPLGTGPVFAGTAIALRANIASGLAALPTSATVPAFSTAIAATPASVAPALFAQLYNQLVGKGIVVNSGKLTTAPPAKARILKSLPSSYTSAFAFESPRSGDLSVGEGYCCSLRDQVPVLNATPAAPDNSISWGQILSYALHQPVLARSLGLIYSFTLDLPSGLNDGGFLYFTLDNSSTSNPWVNDWVGNPDTVKSYASRLPQLTAQPRQLFAATLLPIVATPSSNLTTAQLEAEEYDDGFAQIVHSNQPTTIDAATLQTDQIAPGTESGIQIGWDDEQVTVWFNNQVDMLRDRVSGGSSTPEAPLGVLGYRVDVQIKGSSFWSSLNVVNGSLPFNTTAVGGAASTSISGDELWIAPAPIRPGTADNTTNDQPAWLPLYFAQWNGSSLVLSDPVVQLLAYAVANTNKPLPAPTLPNPNADLTLVPILRYGNDYEFRVRLVDLTGGGPLVSDVPIHGGTAPQTLCNFRRFVPPKALEIEASPALPSYPQTPGATRTIDTLAVRRPRIGYPEAIFAGVDPSVFSLSSLSSLIQDAWANGRSISVPDPDVDSFDIRIEARIPAHDTGTVGIEPGDLDEVFRIIYSVNVPFPTDVGDDDPTVMINLNYTDGIDDISLLGPPPDGTTSVTIPTARDIRVRLYPRCAAKTNYYGTDAPPIGLSTDYIVRQDAVIEDALFPNTPELQIQAFYFQPGTNISQLLAQQLGLNQQSFTLTGASGTRTVFGASGALRHTISADASSLTFSNQTELLGHWIVALVLDVERDWTWDGFGKPAMQFSRDASNIGTIAFPRVVAANASGNRGQIPDRARSRVIFFDALDPHPAPDNFPQELTPRYSVTATFDVAPQQEFKFDLRLPITVTPNQTPKIVSTGIAESPYHHSTDYSETTLRDRYLWIEFDESIADADDLYFGRVLAYGPDPLLAAALLPGYQPSQMLPEAVEPELPIDPEPMRMIFSGQAEDYSGLDAMTELVPATSKGVGKSGRFFLLPLPSGLNPEDLELFGFWTYEFRVGHKKFWSTAQGRYGRPLRVVGVQHPAPHLTCTVHRDTQNVFVTAPYATTVYNGKRVYDLQLGDPQTQIWFMFYAQVLQADGASYRNVLLTHLRGATLFETSSLVYGKPEVSLQHSFNRDPRAGRSISQKAIESLLELIGLPASTAISVLAVEILPGNVPQPRQNIYGSVNLSSEQAQSSQTASAESSTVGTAVYEQEDPLGRNLGLRRILRTSPLTAIPAQC